MNSTKTTVNSENTSSVANDTTSVSGSDYQLFPRRNLLMMAGCVVLIILGFILMCGPGSTVEGGFNPDIFSVRRIIVGPAIAFLGFLLMAFAIIWPTHNKKKH